jgi:MFS family permease
MPKSLDVTQQARRPLYGFLSAYILSLFGTRLTMIALPWLILVTTGSATRTGLVAFCEAVTLLLSKTLAGPLIDRLGARPFSVFADLSSAVVVALVPICYWLHVLPLSVLLLLAALLGLARGPGDVAKRTLTPQVAEAAGVSLDRISGLIGTLDRLAGTTGPAAAGVIVVVFSPLWAMVADAVTFVISAVIITTTVPRQSGGATATALADSAEDGSNDGYLKRLKAGATFLRGDRLLRSIAVMLCVTNLVDAAYGTLLIPVWAHQIGGGAAAIGALGSVFGIAAVAGSAMATVFSQRLRRRPTYVVAFLIGGPPRFLVMAFGLPLWVVLAVAMADGLAIGFVNPIINAVMLERIPRRLLGRVSALTDSVSSAGVPLGPLVAGVAVTLAGLAPVLLVCAGIYLASTVLPTVRPHWQDLNHRPVEQPPPPPADSPSFVPPAPAELAAVDGHTATSTS